MALPTLSASQTTWLFLRRRADLKQEEQGQLNLLLQASPKAKTTYDLVEAFLHMLGERTGEDQLDAWLKEVEASQLEAFTSFITSIQQDKDAVVAGLTLLWSTGPLEGHINRLKLIKRQGYGRAKFDLLRLRVLHLHEAKRGMKDSFESVARRLECDGDRRRFESALGTIARAKAAPIKGRAEAEMSMWEDPFIRLAMASTAESSAAHSPESSRTPCRMFA